MSRKPILIAAMVVLCALMLVAAGCGGKKKAAASSTVESTSAATTAAATTDTTAAATTDTNATTTAASGGGSTADCQSFAHAAADVGTQFSQALSGTGNVDIAKASSAFDSLASKAPSAIKTDFQTIDDAFKKMAVALKGVNLASGKAPDAATLAKLQQLGTQIDQAKLTAAETHISSWVTQNCH